MNQTIGRFLPRSSPITSPARNSTFSTWRSTFMTARIRVALTAATTNVDSSCVRYARLPSVPSVPPPVASARVSRGQACWHVLPSTM